MTSDEAREFERLRDKVNNLETELTLLKGVTGLVSKNFITRLLTLAGYLILLYLSVLGFVLFMTLVFGFLSLPLGN